MDNVFARRDKTVDVEERKNRSTHHYGRVASVGLFFLIGVVYYVNARDWTIIDALYFTLVRA